MNRLRVAFAPCYWQSMRPACPVSPVGVRAGSADRETTAVGADPRGHPQLAEQMVAAATGFENECRGVNRRSKDEIRAARGLRAAWRPGLRGAPAALRHRVIVPLACVGGCRAAFHDTPGGLAHVLHQLCAPPQRRACCGTAWSPTWRCGASAAGSGRARCRASRSSHAPSPSSRTRQLPQRVHEAADREHPPRPVGGPPLPRLDGHRSPREAGREGKDAPAAQAQAGTAEEG